MEFQVVLKMAAYWDIEPPLSWAYVAVHFKQDEKKEKKAMNVIPGAKGPATWLKLPDYIRRDIIKDFMKLHPGKTEADFHKDRELKIKQKYAKRLEEARKAKG